MARIDDVVEFYRLLDELVSRVGGSRRLADCAGTSGWPSSGVYFFFEPGEERTTSGSGPRVVRVGTHALTATSRASLWKRLSAHRGMRAGTFAGGGNSRGSIFRLHVGAAMISRDALSVPTWGQGQSASRDVRISEHPTECLVSRHICAMPFVWLDISKGDDRGRALRASIEANSIGLLSNCGSLGTHDAIDPPSSTWLGHHSARSAVRDSGMWNVRHVADGYSPGFLDDFRTLIAASLQ